MLEFNIPVVGALNLADVANRKGMEIDVPALSRELGIAIVPTVAVKRQGLAELVQELAQVLAGKLRPAGKVPGSRQRCGVLAAGQGDHFKVMRWTNGSPSRLDRLGDAMLKPWPGIPLAALVILLSIGVVVGAGKALRAVLLCPGQSRHCTAL